ncbi:amino acid ABC transporter permease [Roseibium suaedae]|uniref:General L-amino acid transport system permease protein n=1 Tax=Roseibium suaedae TaxID=735517 RepID=A0A1M7NKK2_9HYPH|nr:ABC transporter permease subunit [Roseibium suaedae]SHN04260.1 general L-amino acid transport system permease protein [Roseibium suaedae]
MSVMPRRITKAAVFWQAGFILLLVFALVLAVRNIDANLARAGISVSFDFLSSHAGFDINESLIPVSSESSYGEVLFAGAINTVVLSLICILGATFIGVVMGVLRTSNHYLGVRVALVYIEVMRNLPKLLILLALFLAAINTLPPVRQSWALHDMVFLSNRALYFPALEAGSGMRLLIVFACLWPVSLFVLGRVARRIQDTSGAVYPVFWPVTGFFAAVVAASVLFGWVDYPISYPVLQGFDFQGGHRISIQFLVLAAALSIYHGGQVAELVRGAIEAVPKGQFEASRATGLSFLQMMRLVVLPQAVRIVVPPMGNQYLNITKNTSIALAVGYSDLVSVMTTSINQTFRPIELMTLSMGVYLAICLAVSFAVNAYNARVSLRGG